MIHNLKPCPAMKDSGVPGLGEVPEHWEVRKLRNVLRGVSERNQPGLSLLSVVREKGVILRDVTNKDENYNFIPDDLTNYKVVRKGQFAMNKMKAWQGSYGVSQHDGIVSPAYFIFNIDEVEGAYFHSAIRSKAYVPFFTQASDGVRIGQWDLSQTRMKEIPFFIPPLPEQASIVRFLDYYDRKIRRYIRAKQKLIKLLEVQKHAIINIAVTRGLDPNVRLKPSGVEWLGEVPEHWEVRRLKMVCRMRSGDGITAMSIEPEGEYPVYGGNGVRGYASRYTHDGDFALIGRQGALCGNVHLVCGRFWASEHAVVATLCSGHNLEWFGALLTAMNLNQYSIAAAQPGLAVERIMNLWMPVPPEQEQTRIAKHIGYETANTTKAVDRTHREITLLREYRTRLIADVVTGKLDVREAAARLLEEAEEPELPDEAGVLSDAGDGAVDDLDPAYEEAEA
jgi:type I restriction enzyme S subunit